MNRRFVVQDTWITFDVLKLLCKADPDLGSMTTINLRKATTQLMDHNLFQVKMSNCVGGEGLGHTSRGDSNKMFVVVRREVWLMVLKCTVSISIYCLYF